MEWHGTFISAGLIFIHLYVGSRFVIPNNDYENPLIFLSSRDLFTIPLGLNKFILEDNIDYNGMMAAASAGIVPIIIVFLLGQRYVIEGVANTGIKG